MTAEARDPNAMTPEEAEAQVAAAEDAAQDAADPGFEDDPIMGPEPLDEDLSSEEGPEAVEAPAMTHAESAMRIAELEAEAADLKEKLLRTLAEMENLRRRATREKEEASKYAVTNFARDMLNVADNLGRALEAADDELRASSDAVNGLITGVEMTQKELQAVFARVGIKLIEAEGQRFDTNFHEAMFQVPNPNVPDGTVVQVVQSGYTLADRLLRPAKVGVTTGGPKPATAKAETPTDKTDQSAAKSGGDAYQPKEGGSGQNIDQEL